MSDDLHDDELIPAATVLLLRDVERAGLEVLMLRRNSKIAFGGMWVFPGGRVDDHEVVPDDVVASARTAAVREVQEETGLDIRSEQLVTWSYWVPPRLPAAPIKGPRRRFSTWFFVAPAPGGEVAIDYGEIHEDRWLSPTEALGQHRRREIELAPPTWVTLTQLSAHRSVTEAMTWAGGRQPEEFRTRPIHKRPATIAWVGDVAYDGSGGVEDPGPRHRLVMHADGWHYERT